MQIKIEEGFLDEFKEMEDPRIERCKLHPMEEILFLTICGIICGCESWEDLEDFGNIKQEFLREYLEYKNGIPSNDTLRRFYRALDPKSFQESFMKWMSRFQIKKGKGVIAIDGKSSRRSRDDGEKALHVVSAFASEERIVIGQEKVEEKTNEIIGIKNILSWLDVAGGLVSIDAIGCQTEIANKIVEKKGDYLLGLKGNQGRLHDDVKTFFEMELESRNSRYKFDKNETVEKSHGRIETRECYVSCDINWLREMHPRWETIKSIICIRSIRKIKEKESHEARYYISSREALAENFLASTRSHWSIENSLHWVLDMSFGDDQCRIRKGNAPMNMAIMKHITYNMIRKYKTERQSIKRLRKQAGWG